MGSRAAKNLIVASAAAWLAGTCAPAYAADSDQPCDKVVIHADQRIRLTDNETRLVCGDPKVPAWSDIPLPQARFNMTSFLQARGYHDPSFSERDGKLIVEAGPLTKVRSVTVDGIPEGVELGRYWELIGDPMTPKALDQIQSWVQVRLQSSGYPCPRLTAYGYPDTGDVEVTVEPGEYMKVHEIIEEPVKGLADGVLSRYDAFKVGDPYDSRLLELSSKRILADDVVVSTHFITECVREGAVVKRRVVAGEPRIVAIGVGFDTEKYFMMRSSWKNSRLGPYASVLEFAAELSYVEQEVHARGDWYPAPGRYYLHNLLSYRRKREKKYEERELSLTVAPAVKIDRDGYQAQFALGPRYSHIYTVSGRADKIIRLSTIMATGSVQSHDFEYYQFSPQTGYDLNYEFIWADRALGSDTTVKRLVLSGTKLWSLGTWSPPKFVLGLRGNAGWILPSHDQDHHEKIPESFKLFLGGSRDLRGFSRQSLPRGGEGALTRAYLGTELRFNHILAYKLQPLIFVDAGKFGLAEMMVENTLLWSPGVGIRWESPIGAIRATAAYGMIEGKRRKEWEDATGWQFYASYGELF